MFIKRLELFGFKSFADRTEIELGEGITAIVGPNGCGKSNIADALIWVLGESNVRNLRAQRTTDVIFNGSEKRRALGVAEATLTLDNSCGTLPLSFSEVTITRRTYRSGESEFFINKSRCRLKDIYELFLDTGIGRQAYSMVSQGEIDAVLSAKPEDRRELFEEAAGVKKYRHRREEALRKLEHTESNLHRVRDIVAEIETQLEPLSDQAQQAARYNELTSRLRQIEIGLLIRDLRRNTEALQQARASKAAASGRIEETDRQIAELQAQKDAQATALHVVEEETEKARRLQMNLSATVQRLEGKSALLEERLKSVGLVKSRAQEEMSSLESRTEQTRVRLEQIRHEEAECSEAESRLNADVQQLTQRLAEVEKCLEEASRAASDRSAFLVERAKELAEKRAALESAQERVASLAESLARCEQEIAELENCLKNAEQRSKRAAREIAALEKRASDLTSEIAATTDERDRVRGEAADLSEKRSELAHELAAASSRLATLQELAEAHEGFHEGVRNVMAASKGGKLAGRFAVVADVISVPKGCELAIETALGAGLQNIITNTVSEAKDAIAFLRANKGGRATFLPLDSLRAPDRKMNSLPDRKNEVLGIAKDLVSYDSKHDAAIRLLLGGTVVVKTIDDALALSKKLDGWDGIVSLEGELIVCGGAIAGGAQKSGRASLLSRKQEIDELTARTAEGQKAADELDGKIESLEGALAKLESGLAGSEEELSKLRAAIAERENQVGLADQEAGHASERLALLTAEGEETRTSLESRSASVQRLGLELAAAGEEDVEIDRKAADAAEGAESIRKERDALQADLMRLNVELAGRSERAASLRNAFHEAARAVEDLRKTVESRRVQIESADGELETLASEQGTVIAECERQQELLAAADARLAALSAERTSEHEKAAETESALRDAQTARNELGQEAHDAGVREARLDVQVNQASTRLAEDYEIACDQALAWPEEVEVERGTATEVTRLRREIRDMGAVNTGAVAEYERIKERWDFLSEQRADLESAQDQVDEAIREIDESTRGLFTDTFERAATNFDEMFKRLFGGGRTELTLTDPDDLLATGVDVAVQVPGKKLQDLALLSGGERALTAAALIFALLATKPSPFVVLDEVDAPLDESNVERFAEVLREFAKDSQFIVVTHNRATMEAADNLYGVTTEEPGISKMISVRLTAEGPVESEAPIGALATS